MLKRSHLHFYVEHSLNLHNKLDLVPEKERKEELKCCNLSSAMLIEDNCRQGYRGINAIVIFFLPDNTNQDELVPEK